MEKRIIIAVLFGIATAAAVLVVASLLRSVIRSVTFAEAFKTPYFWYAAGVGGLGAGVACLKKGQKKKELSGQMTPCRRTALRQGLSVLVRLFTVPHPFF